MVANESKGAQSRAEKKGSSKDPVEKLNAQVLRTKAFLEGVRKQIAASLSNPEVKASSKVSLRAALEGMDGDVERMIETAGLVSAGLHRLHKEKWKPERGGRRALAAGDLVAVRDHEIRRFDGAWEKADLKNLRVVSVHGRKVKAEIFRDGLNGGCVGVVPARWLQLRAA